jgi:hypothetical protein
MRMKGWSLGLSITGLVVVVFAIVWLLAIFPAMAKLPADYHKVVNFDGDYYVLNADTQTMDEIPVCVEREQLATDVQGNALLIDETVTCTHALAGMELPQFGAFGKLAVDRSTRAFVSGQGDSVASYSDMERSGQFCFPSDLKKESYDLWVSSAGRPLEAAFTGEEEFNGLKVFDFEVSEQGLDIGAQEGTGIPRVMDIVIDLKVEPVSGATVYTESNSTYSMVPAPDMKIPYYISSIAFTQETIDELTDTAASSRSLILWTSFYGFWIAIAVGAALLVTGIVMAVRSKE